MARRKESPEAFEEKKTTKKKIPTATTAARVNKKTTEGKTIPSEDICEPGFDKYARVKDVAYYLYVNRGRVPGHELSDWLEAEKIVKEEIGDRCRV
ncbi:MAG: DUF2934 domain-containing protein [Candidatus Omnitrophota bacterium]